MVASLPDRLWNAVELREGLSRCACVRLADGHHYARRNCSRCHGAGVLPAPVFVVTSCEGEGCEALHLTTDRANHGPGRDGWVLADDDNDTGTLCPDCYRRWSEGEAA